MRILLFSIWLGLGTFSKAGSAYTGSAADKVITVTANEIGMAMIGNETFTMDGLVFELQTRLWKSFLGTGKMYDAIILKYEGAVDSLTRDIVVKSIKDAMNRALLDVCLQKHKKRFGELNEGQQNKLKKQFPVLFQEDFETPSK